MTRHHPHKQTPPLTPLRRVWLLFALTGLGCCVGVLALLYGAAAYVKLPGLAMFQSYFHHPALLGLNLLPPVLLIWLFYFLTPFWPPTSGLSPRPGASWATTPWMWTGSPG